MRGSDRLLAILTVLGAHRRSSLAEVAERVDLPKPTALRFLRSLEPGGWVRRDPDGHYSLGPAVIGLAGQYLSADAVIVAASPVMRRMRDELGETTTLSRASGVQRTCVQEFPSEQSLRLVLGLGETGPLYAGASGLVLLAHLDADTRQRLLAGDLPALTDRTITSPEELELECAQIRERGWATTHGQRTAGAAAVAVPLKDPAATGGVSALGIYGPEARCHTLHEERRWLDALQQGAAQINDLLARESK
ncbi:MAG: IclR family transcriptional regulator [Nocardioidaceae bacterium]